MYVNNKLFLFFLIIFNNCFALNGGYIDKLKENIEENIKKYYTKDRLEKVLESEHKDYIEKKLKIDYTTVALEKKNKIIETCLEELNKSLSKELIINKENFCKYPNYLNIKNLLDRLQINNQSRGDYIAIDLFAINYINDNNGLQNPKENHGKQVVIIFKYLLSALNDIINDNKKIYISANLKDISTYDPIINNGNDIQIIDSLNLNDIEDKLKCELLKKLIYFIGTGSFAIKLKKSNFEMYQKDNNNLTWGDFKKFLSDYINDPQKKEVEDMANDIAATNEITSYFSPEYLSYAYYKNNNLFNNMNTEYLGDNLSSKGKEIVPGYYSIKDPSELKIIYKNYIIEHEIRLIKKKIDNAMNNLKDEFQDKSNIEKKNNNKNIKIIGIFVFFFLIVSSIVVKKCNYWPFKRKNKKNLNKKKKKLEKKEMIQVTFNPSQNL